jgi:uncharacterized protein (DUF2147 family)
VFNPFKSGQLILKTSLTAATALLTLSLFFSNNLSAQKDQLEKTWLTNGASSKIQMYLASDGTYWGKLTWIKDPIDKSTGKPTLDKENPDENLRNQPLLGLVIMKGFKKNPENKDEYIDGHIYDPSKGHTWCAKITYKGTYLDLRGYICHLSFLGRTEVWTLTDDM